MARGGIGRMAQKAAKWLKKENAKKAEEGAKKAEAIADEQLVKGFVDEYSQFVPVKFTQTRYKKMFEILNAGDLCLILRNQRFFRPLTSDAAAPALLEKVIKTLQDAPT